MGSKTTISMQSETHERLLDAKPFESMSNGEMVSHILDVYEDTDFTIIDGKRRFEAANQVEGESN